MDDGYPETVPLVGKRGFRKVAWESVGESPQGPSKSREDSPYARVSLVFATRGGYNP